MFKIKSPSANSKTSYTKHYLKLVCVSFSKDEFPTKKEVRKYYTRNYKSLGIVLDVGNDELWNEDQDCYYVQLCDLFKQPDQTVTVTIDAGVKFIYAYNKMIIKDEQEIKKFEQQVQKVIQD